MSAAISIPMADPAAEYEESLNKARALVKAVEVAGRGLGVNQRG